jgi:hypothetical protein
MIAKEAAVVLEENQWDQSAIIRQTLANYSAQLAERLRREVFSKVANKCWFWRSRR